MKRTARFLAILLLVLLLVPAARADVLWEPENTFYKTHSKECTVLRRSFYANGSEGYVTVWKAPDSKSYVGQFENGTQIHSWWQYENWVSATFIEENGKRADGWICLDELALIYDHISFQEEYGSKITSYTDEFPAFGSEVEAINLYAYPGAPEIYHTIPLKGDTASSEEMRKLFPSKAEGPVSTVFVDENGLTWGYIGYWQGIRNVWFCLDEPDGENFPTRTIPQVELISVEKKPDASAEQTPDVSAPPAAATQIPVVQQNDTQSLTPSSEPAPPATAPLTPWILVGGVAILTTALLFLLARQRKKGPKN